jgi:WS/DGAT/MGAT family acyltransferase
LPWNAPLGARRKLAFTSLPMAGVKRIKSRLGCSVNDVVLSVLAGGLHRYLEGMGISTERLEVIAMVPVSVRREHESRSLGNRISALMVPLAVDVSQERPRLAATRAVTERLKQGSAWTGIDALLELLDGVPAPLVALAGRSLRLSRIANVVATNVPGPRDPRTLCGQPLVALYPIVPIADGLGLGLAVFSYAGTLYVGLNAAADLVPDLDKLRLGIEESFAALLASA